MCRSHLERVKKNLSELEQEHERIIDEHLLDLFKHLSGEVHLRPDLCLDKLTTIKKEMDRLRNHGRVQDV